MIIDIINWVLHLSQQLSYGGVFILMIIESSFLPMPSEIIVPPAAYLASQGRLDIFLVIVFALLGSLIGATINYLLGLLLERVIIYRLAAKSWAKFLLITPRKIERAEKYFLRNANSATFWGRLIPVIRQLVSIPAGFSRMNYWRFLLWTTLGSGIWIIILAILGYFLGANNDILHQYYREISLGFIVLGIIILGFKLKRKK